MTYLEIGILAACFMLALIGLVLALRAYNVLSEARQLYWQTSAMKTAAGASAQGARKSSPAAVTAAGSKKKLKSNRVRGTV